MINEISKHLSVTAGNPARNGKFACHNLWPTSAFSFSLQHPAFPLFHLSSFPPAIMQLKFLSQFRFSIRNCLPPLLALALFISFISISIRFVQVFRFV